jgi:hypothetical protein
MTPTQKQELLSLVAFQPTRKTLVLLLDGQGHLIPLSDPSRRQRILEQARRSEGSGDSGVEVDGVQITVCPLDTSRGETALAYVVQPTRGGQR